MPAALELPVQIASSAVARQYRWPESDFYVSERHRLVYCPIQKIACSSLKLWWAQLVDGTSAPFVSTNLRGETSIDHFALNEHYKLHYQPVELGQRPLTEAGWLRVVFVRNPWARIVSAFLNKFVPNHDLAKPVFESVHRRQTWNAQRRAPYSIARRLICGAKLDAGLGRRPLWQLPASSLQWRDQMTFAHFVDYLAGCDLDDGPVDHHWSPQYRFLGQTDFNFVGRFENLSEDVRSLSKLLDVNIPLPAANRTSYTKTYQRSFADCPLKRLRKLPSLPDYRQFYTPKLRASVARLYRRDVEQFGYSFDE